MIKNQKLSPMFLKHRDDFAYCERIIKNHSQSFYAAFSTLPKEKAMSVYAIYAFCRKADDIVDEDSDLEALIHLREELEFFEKGKELDHPVWRALRVVFDTYPMDIAPFYDMIVGQKEDLTFTQPETQADLENYSYYVAGTVGLMLLPLLTDTPEKYKKEAIALGIAMQITNILRDIGEDLSNDRIYLPKEIMAKHHYTRDMLEEGIINSNFIALWEYEARLAEMYYEQSLELVYNVNREAKKPLLLSMLFYKDILHAVRSNDYDCFTQRNFVGNRRKAVLFAQAEKMLK